MFEKTTFGIRLRKLRQLHKLSTQQLASCFNIHRASVSNLELGNKSPSVELAFALADYFNVSLGYLVGRLEKVEERNDD